MEKETPLNTQFEFQCVPQVSFVSIIETYKGDKIFHTQKI